MMNHPNQPAPANAAKAAKPRRGIILLAVLVALVLLTLAGYQYGDLMLAEYRASDNAHAAALLAEVKGKGESFSLEKEADWRARNIEVFDGRSGRRLGWTALVIRDLLDRRNGVYLVVALVPCVVRPPSKCAVATSRERVPEMNQAGGRAGSGPSTAAPR